MANSTKDTVIENLKSMTSWSERIDYIWTYFKVQILMVLGIGGVIVGLIISLLTPEQAVLKIMALNIEPAVSITETFDPFLAENGYKTGEKSIIFDQAYIVDPKDDAHLEEIMPFLMRFSTPQDLFIGTGVLYENIVENGVLADLRQILDPEQLEGRQLLYTDENGMVDPYPCAVLVESNGLFSTDYYIGVCILTESPEAAIGFLNYVLSL